MQDMDKIIDELTLMLLYLTSWQECPTEGIRHKPIRTAEKLRLCCHKRQQEHKKYNLFFHPASPCASHLTALFCIFRHSFFFYYSTAMCQTQGSDSYGFFNFLRRLHI